MQRQSSIKFKQVKPITEEEKQLVAGYVRTQLQIQEIQDLQRMGQETELYKDYLKARVRAYNPVKPIVNYFFLVAISTIIISALAIILIKLFS